MMVCIGSWCPAVAILETLWVTFGECTSRRTSCTYVDLQTTRKAHLYMLFLFRTIAFLIAADSDMF